MSSPDNPSATAGRGGTNPPGRGRKAPAVPSVPAVLQVARGYIAAGDFDSLDEKYVKALLAAGDTLPRVVADNPKFSALCEAHNPVPG